ncbi:MBL fold metallo-hydrolase [Ohtaekwangia koreensis]|uniref:Glyoxylase, beta-lactamase superfamily II n=1 Tax=Ohtaekwangia koreensis TaxID=688867 RepID=A0A1T5M296_9BACT|nr:MBL fold metallo-hydrolase [Ohtaekwangia koreensis]SKC82350.1 Glyoxylase, beta-lactamase superfamily II [Ohtaekwangia koreensis]
MNIPAKPSAYDYSIAPGVWGKKDVFVNYYFIQDSETKAWFLVDAGLKWSAPRIKAMARDLFGEGSKPAGIILTHGHFDHVGALHTLAQEWSVPIYAHTLELPYLTGKSSYPPADPTVGGGLMSSMSWMYPKGPIDIQPYIQPLLDNSDNVIPGLSGWRYIHTPGHSPGHISLFRESDKVLIAGDAVVTTRPESALYALSYKKQLSGPPKYFTCNWASAKISVLKLAALDPQIIATGHGEPMQGEEMQLALQRLSTRFEKLAQPEHGRYVNEPAVTDETGVVYLPPAVETSYPTALKVVGISLAVLSVGFLIYYQAKKRAERKSSIGNDLLSSALKGKSRHALHHLLN